MPASSLIFGQVDMRNLSINDLVHSTNELRYSLISSSAGGPVLLHKERDQSPRSRAQAVSAHLDAFPALSQHILVISLHFLPNRKRLSVSVHGVFPDQCLQISVRLTLPERLNSEFRDGSVEVNFGDGCRLEDEVEKAQGTVAFRSTDRRTELRICVFVGDKSFVICELLPG